MAPLQASTPCSRSSRSGAQAKELVGSWTSREGRSPTARKRKSQHASNPPTGSRHAPRPMKDSDHLGDQARLVQSEYPSRADAKGA